MYFNHAFRKTLLGTTVSGDTTKTQTNILVAGIAVVNSTKVAASTPSTGFVTFTTDAVHGLVVGDQVVVSGITTVIAFNGTYTVTSVPTTTKFVVASATTGTTQDGAAVINCLKTTVNLTAGSIGLYKQDFTPLNWSTVDGTTSKVPFYLVQGSYYKNSGYSDKIGSHGGYQESVKSKMINPKYISRIFWVQAKAPVQQVVQIFSTPTASGLNVGLNADTTYRLRIDVKGSPALRFLSHNIYRVMDSYTGPLNATNPTFQKDPVATLVDFKEQITMSPYFNQLVQARVYKSAGAAAPASSVASITTTSVAITWGTIPTYAAIGQRVTGTGLPVNSFITAISSNTATVTYPTQAVAPTIGGTVTVSFFNDLYGSNGGYTTPYTNITVTSGQQPTYVGQPTYIPGSSDYTTGPAQTSGVATNATILANTAGTSNGAIIYQPVADAASFTFTSGQEPFIELTAAYLETKFGNPTFTVTDNYDLEPLKIIASLMDDSGSTTVTAPIGQGLAGTSSTYKTIGTLGDAGIAYVAQASSMAQGAGETVLRELILTGRYRQEAFGDGTNIDQFRMREIEANPGVMDMMTVAKRNSLYNKLCILHNVPRFNNPTGVFDNDQYLIEIAIPNTVAFSNLFTTTFTVTSGSTYTSLAGNGLGDFILETSNAAGGAQFVEII